MSECSLCGAVEEHIRYSECHIYLRQRLADAEARTERIVDVLRDVSDDCLGLQPADVEPVALLHALSKECNDQRIARLNAEARAERAELRAATAARLLDVLVPRLAAESDLWKRRARAWKALAKRYRETDKRAWCPECGDQFDMCMRCPPSDSLTVSCREMARDPYAMNVHLAVDPDRAARGTK